MTRTRRIDAMQTKRNVDVVIIGAGVNGAGLFRDLCEQGVDCLIVDKADFGSGASAAPSRLIHGGLKYLETGEFRLVAQSTLERNLLLKNAPHLVHPLPTIIPIFSWTNGVFAALRTLLGLEDGAAKPRRPADQDWPSDLRLLWRTKPRHAAARYGLSRPGAQGYPALTPAIVAVGTYYDAKIVCRSASFMSSSSMVLPRTRNSAAANYTDPAFAGQDGALTFVCGRRQDVHSQPANRCQCGGSVDRSGQCEPRPSTRMIGGTKGSHILLKHDELVRSLAGRMIYFEADDGRICLVYGYLGLALVGSTDIVADDPDTCAARRTRRLSLEQSVVTVARLPIRPVADRLYLFGNSTSPGLRRLDSRPHQQGPFVADLGGRRVAALPGCRAGRREMDDLPRFRRRDRRWPASAPRTPPKSFDPEPRDWRRPRIFRTSAAARDRWLAESVCRERPRPRSSRGLLGRYGTTALLVARHIAGSRRTRRFSRPGFSLGRDRLYRPPRTGRAALPNRDAPHEPRDHRRAGPTDLEEIATLMAGCAWLERAPPHRRNRREPWRNFRRGMPIASPDGRRACADRCRRFIGGRAIDFQGRGLMKSPRS